MQAAGTLVGQRLRSWTNGNLEPYSQDFIDRVESKQSSSTPEEYGQLLIYVHSLLVIEDGEGICKHLEQAPGTCGNELRELIRTDGFKTSLMNPSPLIEWAIKARLNMLLGVKKGTDEEPTNYTAALLKELEKMCTEIQERVTSEKSQYIEHPSGTY